MKCVPHSHACNCISDLVCHEQKNVDCKHCAANLTTQVPGSVGQMPFFFFSQVMWRRSEGWACASGDTRLLLVNLHWAWRKTLWDVFLLCVIWLYLTSAQNVTRQHCLNTPDEASSTRKNVIEVSLSLNKSYGLNEANIFRHGFFFALSFISSLTF